MQEWAKNTGRWKEGDPEPNYAQLKTRLRCAFNKAPDIDEIKELHCTKSEEPYKVYRFTERRGEGGNVTSAGWQVTLCDPMWHVSSRSGVATLRTAIHLLLTYCYLPRVQPATRTATHYQLTRVSHCPLSMRSRLYATVGCPSVGLSVRLSVRPPLLRICCCGLSSQKTTIDCCMTGRPAVSSTARSSECGQCHVVSQGTRLNADFLGLTL